jgi:hypothetical protein
MKPGQDARKILDDAAAFAPDDDGIMRREIEEPKRARIFIGGH